MPRDALRALPALLLAVTGCRSTAPRYVVTSSPIELGVGSPLCVAVDPAARAAVWWWQPGRSGCSTRSTGPGLFDARDAAVAAREGAAGVDVRFRIPLHRALNSPLPDVADLHLVLIDGQMVVPATGVRVTTMRRDDLDVPELCCP